MITRSLIGQAVGWVMGVLLAVCSVGCASATPELDPTPLTSLQVEVVEENAVWTVAMDIAPDGRLFYAQQNGSVFVKSLTTNANGDYPPAKPLIERIEVSRRGNESGLLGLTLSPDFEQTHHFYVYYTVPDTVGNPLMGRITRFTEVDGSATEETIIVDDLPAYAEQDFHFGGSLDFGPDGKLYLIYGDTNRTDRAQDPLLPEGSVLRYNPDGSIPDDNPFHNSPVYAYGIRNGFGLAWHPQTGLLYQTENGERCDDELNLIKSGENYGWGIHRYDTCPYPDGTGIVPLFEWTPVIAPTGITFYTGDLMPEFNGRLLMCAFNLSSLYNITLDQSGGRVDSAEIIEVAGRTDLCRIDILQGPDDWLYTTTGETIYRIGR